MRPGGSFAAALLAALSLAVPAEAGVHAIYRLDGEAMPLVVDVADNGDASFMQEEGEVRVIVSGGHALVVGETENGLMVARVTDIGEALAKTGAPAIEMDVKDVTELARFKQLAAFDATPIGPRTVGGVAGTAYRLGAGPRARSEGGDEMVATNDAELRPIGQALGIILTEGAGALTLFDRIGPDMARWMRILAKLAALGTPIEMKGLYALRSVERRRVPPETIALPGTPMSREALIRHIRALSPGG